MTSIQKVLQTTVDDIRGQLYAEITTTMEVFFATQLQWIGTVGELTGRASGLSTTFFNYPRGCSFRRSGQTK